MYTEVSEAFKQAVKGRVVTTKARLTFESFFSDSSDLVIEKDISSEGLKIADYCFDEESGKLIGTAATKEVEIEIINTENYNLENKEFKLEIGTLVDRQNSVYEYVPYGAYVVMSSEDLKSANKYRLIANDLMIKLNEPVRSNTEFNPEYPITAKEYYREFMASYGIEIEEQELCNEKFIIENPLNFEENTGRYVLGKLAELFGSFAKINRNNKCQMYLKTETDEIIELSQMNTELEIDKRYGNVNVVSIGLSQVEGENVTKVFDKRPDVKEYKGTTEQETREGYNLLQINKTDWELTEKGIKNKSINEAKRLDNGDILLKANTTYYLNFVLFNRPSSDTSFTSYIDNVGKGIVSFSGIQNFEINKLYTKTYTPTKDEAFKIAMWGNGNKDIFEFQYWITTDSTKTTYEQYGVSPSIEFPSEVKGVSGHYDITVENKNFNFRPYKDGNGKITNGITFSVNNDGSVVANGTATANAYFYLHTHDATPYLNLEKGIYTISGGINSNCKVIARLYKGSVYIAGATDSGKGSILNTTNYDYDRVLLFIEISSGQACNNLIFKPQIEKNTVATDYVSHNSQTFTVNLGNMEIYKDEYIHNKDGKWYKYAKYKKNIPTTYRILTNQPLNDFILVPKLEDDIGYNTYAHPLNMRSNKAIAKNINYSIDTTNTFGGNGSVTNYMFGVKKGITTTEADEFINGLYIIYELKTPVDEEITDKTLIAQLDTIKNELYFYEGINHISFKVANGLDGELKIEYYNETYTPNTKIVEGSNITVTDAAGNEEEITLRIDDNEFLYTEELREKAIDELFERLKGFTYVPVRFKHKAMLYTDCGDMIKVRDIKTGKTVDTIVLNQDINIPKTRQSIIDSPALSNNKQKYKYISKSKQAQTKTEIKVDKHEQQLQSIVKEIGDRTEKTTTITQDLESIELLAKQKADITNTVEGNGKIILENTMAGELLELYIYGNNSVFKPLLPSDTLYPSDDLYPMGDSLIKVTRQTIDKNGDIVEEESEIIDLEQEEELRQKDDVRDEIFLTNNELKITRRIGVYADGTTYIKETPETKTIKDLKILTVRGNLIVEILNYTAPLKSRYVTINDFTNTFTTTVEMQATIKLLYDQISLDVSHKVDNNEIFARMNMYIRGLGDQTDIPDDIPKSVIEFLSNSFSWDSDNSSLSPDGILTLRNKTTEPYQYTINDVLAVQNYIKGNTSLTPELIRLYDATGDGTIDIRDAVKMLNIINGSEQSDKYANATIILNPKNPTEFITMKLEDAIQCKIGLNEIYNYTFRGMNMFLGTYADMNNQYGVSINGEKGIITVRNEDAVTETRIDAGKVDAYYVLSSSRNKKGRCLHGTDESHDYLCNWNGSKLQFYVDDTNVGELSDERVKSEIGNINEGLLSIVEELEVRQFKLANREGKISVGVIAQELLKLFEKYKLNPDDYDFVYNGQFKLTDETIYFFVNYEQLLVLQNVVLKRKLEKQETKLNYIIEKLGLSEEMEDLFNGTDKLV